MSNMPTIPGAVSGRMVQAPISAGARPGMTLGASGMSVQDVIRVLKKRMWLVIFIATATFVISGVITYLWAKYAPGYTAEAMVEVKTPLKPAALRSDTVLANKDVMLQHMHTQARLLASMVNMQEAVKHPVIKSTDWFKSWGNDARNLLLDMDDRLNASPIPRSWLLRVTFTWHDPKESAAIVNTVVETYLRTARQLVRGATEDRLRSLQNEKDNLEQEIKRQSDRLKRLRATQNIPLLESRQLRAGDEVAAIMELLQISLTERARARAIYNMYSEEGAGGRMSQTPDMQQAIEADFQVRSYEFRMSDLNIALANARDKGPQHRMVEELERQITFVQEQLNQRKSELRDENFRQAQASTRSFLDTTIETVYDQQNRLHVAKAELASLEGGLAIYRDLEKGNEEMRDRQNEIDRFLLELDIQRKSPELLRVDWAARAPLPLERSTPLWKINLPAGGILGLLIGVGLAFMLEFMSGTVRTPSDVVRQLNMPLLGQIPSQDDDEATAGDMNRLLVDSPQSMLAESFRQLRTNFLFSAPADQQRSVLLTSCSPEEGKTCIAVNLSTALALAGRKTLLVDANFRRPSVSETFGIPTTAEGLSNLLVGHADPQSLIRKTQHENLDVLPSGPLPPSPAELLGSSQLKDFIQQFMGKYETIIFDSPPLLVVTDAMILATSVDGVIVTIRAGVSAYGAVRRAREQLHRVGARLLGVVLNDVKITRGGYFREMYQTYYDYQSQSQPALPAETEKES